MMPTAYQGAADCEARRLDRLRARLAERKLSLLLVTSPANIFYLTGFRGSAGAAAFGETEARLWVDPRYTLEARKQARGVEVIEERGDLLEAAGSWIHKQAKGGPRQAGFDERHLTCAAFLSLPPRCARKREDAFWRPAAGIVEELRAVKDAGEIELIRKAGKLTAEVFEEVRPLAKPGASEADLVAEIEYRLRLHGAEGVAFETIVASGRRAALPHARASAKRIEAGELVIFDLGAILGGYAADMTRTLYLGSPGGRAQKLYQAVLDAQRAAVEAVREGARAGQVDAAARRTLKRWNLGRYFVHSTGHGVGIEVHERPRLGRGEKSKLQAGAVVTAEPGVYLEGWGGIRIEDTLLVEPAGAEILTPAPKSDWATA